MTGSIQCKGKMYYAVLNYKNAAGERKQKWVRSGIKIDVERGKAVAEKFLKDTLEEYAELEDNGEILDYALERRDILFTDFVLEFLAFIESQVDPITYQGYQSSAMCHIIPFFERKKLKLRNVLPIHIQEYYNEMYKSGKIPKKSDSDGPIEGLASASIRKHAIVLNQAFNFAIFNCLIKSNPVTAAKIPKAKGRYIANFYNISQANQLLEKAQGSPIYYIIVMTLSYGFRRSEVLGLRWSCFDFSRKLFSVNHTVVQLTKIIAKDSTKTDSSMDVYPILENIEEILYKIRQTQASNRKLYGDSYFESDYVFTWPDGRPFRPDYISHKFSKIIKQSDLPHVRFHDLRHSCASILFERGWDIKAVQSWMRHKNVKTTLEIYVHIQRAKLYAQAKEISTFFPATSNEPYRTLINEIKVG